MPRWAPGQRTFSTCLDLDLPLINDVNGWYRSLGVMPRVPRRDLVRAYRELDGSDDVWLTHCFSQLMNRETRRAYDRCEWGRRFWDDHERREARRALLRLIPGLALAEPDTDEKMPVFPRSLDNSEQEGEDLQHGLWGWRCFSTDPGDEDSTDTWRHHVASAASDLGLHTRMSVGRHAHGEPWEVRITDDGLIFSLHCSASPTARFARDAVTALYPALTSTAQTA